MFVVRMMLGCAILGLATGRSAHSASDPKIDNQQLARTFALSSSENAKFAEHRVEQTFYVQIEAFGNNEGLRGEKCVDKGFLSTVRQWLSKDAKRLVLVAKITPPEESSAFRIPLFEVSADETQRPPRCLTDIVASSPITPLYVASSTNDFSVEVQIQSQETTNLKATSSVVNAAAPFLSLTSGSGWLLRADSRALNDLQEATQAIDASLSNAWSQSNQQTFRFKLNPWPSNDNWNDHLDTATFSAGTLKANAGGIEIDGSLAPTVALRLRYVHSVFGLGLGRYNDEDGILNKKLGNTNGNSLSDVFAIGVAGFSTANASTIADKQAMSAFCGSMRTNFSKFLTRDDRLAARHAVLRRRTNFYSFNELRNADGCISPEEESRLKELNPEFAVASLARMSRDNRGKFVVARGTDLVTPALLTSDIPSITAALADPQKFRLSVSPDAASAFPDVLGTKSTEAIGPNAIESLVTAGPFHSGCWQALKTQNLRNMVGIVMNKRTNKTAAILVEFDTDYPGSNANVEADKGKVTHLSFLSVDLVRAVTQLSDWPDQSCRLMQ